MRLIDADALRGPLMAFDSKVQDIVDNAPTIDPFKDKSLEQLMDDAFTRGYYRGREVFNPAKHGHWVEISEDEPWFLECSACGVHVDNGIGGHRWRYCPSCGARMLKGGEK